VLDAIKGVPLLFMPSDEVRAQWEFITPILEGWQKSPAPKLPNYQAGTWGPEEANKLIADRQGGWREP
jgi:glucose-6-phosphate 1-dehydrogenase